MLLPRIIPVLLLRGKGLCKGVRFKNHVYVGDPMNAVHIFDAKEVDELLILDIEASKQGRTPPLDLVTRVADQCLMPFGVGGGVVSVPVARDLLSAGAEKICLNTAALEQPDLVSRLAESFGSQSVLVCLDVKKSWTGRSVVVSRRGSHKVATDVEAVARDMVARGAGELIVQSVDRDGTMEGYDLDLTRTVSRAVDVPVIALGGAGTNAHLRQALVEGEASAAAAGSMFVFHGPRRAVLITYPEKAELERVRRK
ncbi:histidine biosynthesis protein [Solidesulfovibrio fructosivorans JJ]]|uniref:imidazole glycerol-phosphate synthase n=1 Tax=Solidesulfovibrio fructosivorans JJ] TaxID=596151 RepID=E1JXR5_SOLFR|nr:AglZ/HisF2 family acetamidino modification protein [Solidesulfovibrio fructosivorans]EFL50838.1 histidine biosynthesis protein [Solidesulfovibrio fructosivorans JJ]]